MLIDTVQLLVCLDMLQKHIIIWMVKYFWLLKDLNVLVELLFVTIKNAVQGHNLQARNMCTRCQETAFHGF